MKFSCTQENLHNGLSIVSNIATRSANLPILNNILFNVQDGKIDLAVTNLEIGVNYFIRGKIEKEGSYTLPARILSDYIGLLPKEKIDLELKDSTLFINSSGSKTKIRGIDPSEFPLIPQIKRENPYFCDIDELVVALQQVLFAVSTDINKPVLCGVYFQFDPEIKKITIVGTDSYRLGEKIISLKEKEGSSSQKLNVLAPSRTISELLRILNNLKKNVQLNEEGEQDSGDLAIYLSENQILFHYDNFDLISRVLEGQYPDYRLIMPENLRTEAVVHTHELINAVKTSSLFARAGVYDIVMALKGNKIIISSVNSQLGENISQIQTHVKGEENSVILNYKYLLDGLNNINSPEVRIEISDNNVPCIFRPVVKDAQDTRDYLYVIMPIRQ